jgi:predicted flap endonuclease-1-like 5' DNA nuclease
VRAVAHAFNTAPAVNGLLLLALIALIAIAVVVAYRFGIARAQRASRDHSASIERLGPPPREASESVEQWRATELSEDRHRLFRGLADARAETARYRQLLVDLENNAPPPLLDGPGSPDDLKLIVGIGPVLERMLQQIGVNSYRQIARWSDRDIDEFDARLHEFPGRIRRDGWVTQARALHHAKYGETLPVRERS